jgi:hypothetical protein
MKLESRAAHGMERSKPNYYANITLEGIFEGTHHRSEEKFYNHAVTGLCYV